MTTIEATGDPGNEITVLCATETARLLAEGQSKAKGFTTVSQAFGPQLIKALAEHGVKFQTTLL